MPELLNLKEAAAILSVSKVKMAQLVREGVLTTQRSTLDKRAKLVRREDVERLASEQGAAKKVAA